MKEKDEYVTKIYLSRYRFHSQVSVNVFLNMRIPYKQGIF